MNMKAPTIMKNMSALTLRPGLIVLILGMVVCTLQSAPAQNTPEDELTFASALVEMGFSDLADRVIANLKRNHPEMKDRIQSAEVEVLIAQRKYAEAEKIVNGLPKGDPKSDAVRLALANGYYRMGENDKAQEIYEAFFKEYEGKNITDKDLRRFYSDAAYRYAQMQEFRGNIAGALKGYENVLNANPDPQVARQMMYDMSVLYLKLAEDDPENRSAHVARAEKLCEEVMWKGIDIWFGKCLANLAQIQLLQGKKEEARQMLIDNMAMIKQVDDILKQEGIPRDLSPVAGVRYMLGDMYRQQADEMAQSGDGGAVSMYGRALGEYFNVFAKYAGSEWGPKAGEKAQEVKAILEDKYGKEVNVDLGPYASQAAAAQLDRANMLFREKSYKEAIDEYLRIMNQYAEAPSVVKAFVSLVQCYLKTDNDLYAMATVSYVAERFRKDENAPMALLLAGKHYFDKQDLDHYKKVYDLYVDSFPDHDKVPLVLYSMAVSMSQQERQEEYLAYLQRIVDNHPKSQYYPKAINQLAWSYYLGGQYEKAIDVFRKYIEETLPGSEQARAQYSLADCLLREKRYTEALREYNTLKKWLTPEDNPYAQTEDERKKNRELLEKAAFYIGYCLMRIDTPEDKVPAFRALAQRTFNGFIESYPESDMAPRALSALGRIYLEKDEFDNATETFNQLAEKYPNSPEGKSSLYSLIKAAMQIENYEIASEAFNKMLGEAAKYSTQQFALIGGWMLEAEQYAEAMKAYERVVMSGTEERKLLEQALFGIGKAYFQQERYEESTDALAELMEKYPQSALFYETKFLLGKAYRELDRIDEAVEALNDVFKYAQDALLRTQADYELGRIYKRGGQVDEALASFQRVALLADPEDPVLRPIVEKCLYESLDLFAEAEKYNELLDAAEQYLEVFAEDGQYIADVRKKQASARLKASMAPSEPAGGGAENL